jgi:hypothetical protein
MTSATGVLHAALATLSIALGLLQFVWPKRGAGHRARGYAYVYGLIVADAAALGLYRFTGQFNILHVGAILNALWIVLAMIPLLQAPRRPGWHIRHYYFIAWSYVSLMSAGMTQLSMHLVPVQSRQAAWMVIAAASLLTVAIGYVLIQRHRPDRTPPVVREGALP